MREWLSEEWRKRVGDKQGIRREGAILHLDQHRPISSATSVGQSEGTMGRRSGTRATSATWRSTSRRSCAASTATAGREGRHFVLRPLYCREEGLLWQGQLEELEGGEREVYLPVVGIHATDELPHDDPEGILQNSVKRRSKR